MNLDSYETEGAAFRVSPDIEVKFFETFSRFEIALKKSGYL